MFDMLDGYQRVDAADDQDFEDAPQYVDPVFHFKHRLRLVHECAAYDE